MLDTLDKNQIRVLNFGFLIAAAVCAVLTIFFATQYFLHSLPVDGQFATGRINPNYASVESLVRLPGIGTTRAEAIVRYRQDVVGDSNCQIAFRDCNDLVKVSGIGPKTVGKISRWFIFN
ncbi:MAG: helix-hairpin-helix domain-containing protein [Planctomycetota bacterium]